MTLRPFVTLVLATSAVLFSCTPAWAGIQPDPFRTGLFGVAPGQAIRLSVLNAGNEGGTINPCFHPDLAGFKMTIASPAGRVLFESHHKTLPAGQGTFTDFLPVPDDGVTATSTRVPGDGSRGRRSQMRADVAVELAPIPEDGLCTDAMARRQARRLLRQVHLTLEVYDLATGRTEFTLPFSEVMFNPQPEPPEPVRVTE